MKTRSVQDEPANIAASVKARRNPIVTENNDDSLVQITNEVIASLNLPCNNISSTENSNLLKDVASDKKNAGRVIVKTVWSLEDKISFFTALKNYGKNFGDISRYIKGRYSKISQKDVGKSKEQVRVFYQRTFNNIKSFIKFPIELPAYVQELYALINYGVFRGRVKKKLNSRLGERLNELVNKGSTVIKIKGKRITLRTPVCPALKRLNNVNAPEREYSIPDDVVVELVPRNYTSLWRVQHAEQNPRIRMKIAVNRQLSDVVQFVTTKYSTAADNIREALSITPVESPKLFIRLADNNSMYKEISIRELLKPRLDSITLKRYCVNTAKSSGTLVTDKEVEEAASNSHTENAINTTKLDFKDLEKTLQKGVGLEEAKQIKILSVYIGLGCPDVIKFGYEYLYPADLELAHNSITNGLRRLIHLSKNEFLETQQKKETKSQLEHQVEKLRVRALMLRDEVKELEFMRTGLQPDVGEGGRFGAGALGGLGGSGGISQGPIVYKKQHEAMQQFIDELPNRHDVVVKQVEYSQCSGAVSCNTNTSSATALSSEMNPPSTGLSNVSSIKQFNRLRRKQRVTQKKPALIVQMPFPMGLVSAANSANVSSTTGVAVTNYGQADVYFNPDHYQQMNCVEPVMVQHVPQPRFIDEDTSDSLHSLLNVAAQIDPALQQVQSNLYSTSDNMQQHDLLINTVPGIDHELQQQVQNHLYSSQFSSVNMPHSQDDLLQSILSGGQNTQVYFSNQDCMNWMSNGVDQSQTEHSAMAPTDDDLQNIINDNASETSSISINQLLRSI